MKKYIYIFFVLHSLISNANNQKTIVKFYPLAFSFGKLYYCSDFKFGIEQKIKQKSSIEIAAFVSFPNPRFLLGKLIISTLANRNNITYFYGGGGCLSYKYHLNKKNLYIGAKICSAIYKTIGTTTAIYEHTDNNTSSSPYKINCYMNSANFIVGWASKTKTGIDLSLEVGYRYNRIYYLYENQKIEMRRGKNIYDYLRFPLRIGIDASFNLNTIFKKD